MFLKKSCSSEWPERSGEFKYSKLEFSPMRVDQTVSTSGRKLNTLVNLTMGKSYRSVITFACLENQVLFVHNPDFIENDLSLCMPMEN